MNGPQLATSFAQVLKKHLVSYWMEQFQDLELLLETVFQHLLHSPLHLTLHMDRFNLYGPLGVVFTQCSSRERTLLHALLRKHYEQPCFRVHVGVKGYTLHYTHFSYNAVMDPILPRVPLLKHLCRKLLKLFPSGAAKEFGRQMLREHIQRGIASFETPNHPFRLGLQTLLEKT